MSTAIPADLGDALYALKQVFRDDPIPTDRTPQMQRDELIQKLMNLGVSWIQASKLIDHLVSVGVFEAQDPTMKEGERIEFNMKTTIGLDGSDRGSKITPIRKVAINRTAWELFISGMTDGECKNPPSVEQKATFEKLVANCDVELQWLLGIDPLKPANPKEQIQSIKDRLSPLVDLAARLSEADPPVMPEDILALTLPRGGALTKAIVLVKRLKGWASNDATVTRQAIVIPLERNDSTRCPECKFVVPPEYSTLPRVICSNCRRWELSTGIVVMPVAGPPGTPPSPIRLHAPLWQPVPTSPASPSSGGEKPEAGGGEQRWRVTDVPLDPSTMAAAQGMLAHVDYLATTNTAVRSSIVNLGTKHAFGNATGHGGRPIAEPASNPTAPPPASALDIQALAAVLGDDNAAKILKLAHDDKLSVDQKCRLIATIDCKYYGYDSPEWTKLLLRRGKPVSDGAVRQTQWWREDRPKWLNENRADREDERG